VRNHGILYKFKGKNAPVGTGTFDLLWNIEKVKNGKIGI